ncbi:putative aromatic di-alanine and TPR containing protein [Rhizoctonia solani 123E]|uniref:Putative aromatic di-alanine and TPR containing protein n=1 Tax=Rhizoctonia solani 123E TaxID=1423351 RepID=A0A074RUD7_9AGAM|nr:putative aromatic di-alanine and TPR containing protein [Rhizoctonia solani 123E]
MSKDSSAAPDDDSTIDYHARFHRLGDIADLDKHIEIKERAVLQDPDNPYLLGPLGESYQCRFNQRKALTDLDNGIKYIELTLSHAPDGHPGVYSLLTFLGLCHHQRFHVLGEIEDLDKDIAYKTRAVSMESDSPDLSVITGLGRAYRIRFQRLGDLGDLEKSIEYGARAVSLTPDHDPDLCGRLDSLGNSHLLRFQRLDDPSELDKGIEFQTRAASLTPQGHQDFPDRLNNLAASFNMRYNRLGDANDLEKSMEYSIHALSLIAPTNSSLQIRVLANLSILQLLRFQLLKDPKDIEKGIEYSTRAFSLTSGDHPDEALRLKHLGELYYARFRLLGNADDLDLAIKSVSRAVSLLSDEDEDLGDQLDHLGGYIHARWHTQHDFRDLDNDISYKSRSVALTPEYHSRRSRRIESLGRSYLCKSLSSHPCDHQQILRLALDCFRQASFAEANLPLMKFKSALIWARSSLRLSLAESLEAYQVTVDLIPHVIWLGSTVAQRYRDVEEMKSLAEEAASIAIKAQDFKRALEWLEQGQSVVMNQSMMLRSPLDDLRSVEPVLAEVFEKVTTELQVVALRDQVQYEMVSNISLNSPETMADRHRQLAKEHADILSRVRQLPGFENFLKPKRASELQSAAQTGPVVIVTIYMPSNPLEVLEYSCDALILQPGASEIAHLPLQGFNSRTSANMFSRFNSSIMRGSPVERGVHSLSLSNQESDFASVLATLWKDIVKPVIDFLGYKPSQYLDELPHITWCPIGALSSLPFHAAGIYGASKSCAFDYVISSYAPSLTALLSSTPISKATSILAISQEHTPGSHSILPGAAQELAYIQEHAGNVISYTQLINEEATSGAVLDAMEHHACVHLACHAHQNFEDPTKSGFFLHDGTLDLVSILRRSFKNKGLAFLSACQTAMGDKKLPNEVVHLASGMLTAGYPSVIATMWSVWDKDAPFIADRVYRWLLKDGEMDCRNSAKALHHATRALQQEIGDDKFERWVPFIHIGT